MAISRRLHCLFAAALAASGLGCEQSSAPAPEARIEAPELAAGKPRVVIAILDSGINPYHEFFNASDARFSSPIYPPGSPPSAVTPEVLAEFGIDPSHILRVRRTGDPAADVAADAGLWARVKPNEPYWLYGTNIIAVGRIAGGLAGTPDTGPLILPDDEADAHGVASVAAALAANPEAVIYFVEHNNDDTSADIGSEDIHRIGFLHPAVDLISTSYVSVDQPELKAAFSSFAAVVRMGKLHFSPAYDFGPWPTFTTAGAGPWWSIGITSMSDGESNGRSGASGFFGDFAGDDKQSLPMCATCESGAVATRIGLSVASPHAAGVASRVLLEARRAAGHAGGIRLSGGAPVMVSGASGDITNWQVRRALEQAAYVPTLAEYDPSAGGYYLPIQDAAPWLQVGWGVLSAIPEKDVVGQALAFLGLGEPSRSKPVDFCDFQTRLIQERHLYWDNVSPLADTLIPDYVAGEDVDTGGDGAEPLERDPFIYCAGSLPS